MKTASPPPGRLNTPTGLTNGSSRRRSTVKTLQAVHDHAACWSCRPFHQRHTRRRRHPLTSNSPSTARHRPYPFDAHRPGRLRVGRQIHDPHPSCSRRTGGAKASPITHCTLNSLGGRLLKRWIAMPAGDTVQINERLTWKLGHFIGDAAWPTPCASRCAGRRHVERIASRIAAASG